MSKANFEIGDVVQIDPEHDRVFGATLMVLTKIATSFVQGYVLIPSQPHAVQAFYRAEKANVHFVGKVEFMRGGE